MQLILPCGRVAIIDDIDAALIAPYKLNSDIRTHTVYVRCWYVNDGKRKYIYLHQLIGGYDQTDHCDGNGLNNMRANLRRCSNSENCWNASKKRRHKRFKGIYFEQQRQKWRVRIRVNHKMIDGGFFASETDAAYAYDELARKYHGDFARFNFPKRFRPS